jgi:hypothetical protein
LRAKLATARDAECFRYNKRSDVNDGGAKKFRITFTQDNPECAVQRAFIYMD